MHGSWTFVRRYGNLKILRRQGLLSPPSSSDRNYCLEGLRTLSVLSGRLMYTEVAGPYDLGPALSYTGDMQYNTPSVVIAIQL